MRRMWRRWSRSTCTCCASLSMTLASPTLDRWVVSLPLCLSVGQSVCWSVCLFCLFAKSLTILQSVVQTRPLCVCACVWVYVFLASDCLETIEVIIIKLGTVTASDRLMHHMSTILTLTFIQGHTDLNHENNICLIISTTIQAMPIKLAVEIVPLKVYMIIASLVTLTFTQGLSPKVTSVSQTWLLFKLQYLGQYLRYDIFTWHNRRPGHCICAHARFNDLDLDARL